jgi:hypothetical protein
MRAPMTRPVLLLRAGFQRLAGRLHLDRAVARDDAQPLAALDQHRLDQLAPLQRLAGAQAGARAQADDGIGVGDRVGQADEVAALAQQIGFDQGMTGGQGDGGDEDLGAQLALQHEVQRRGRRARAQGLHAQPRQRAQIARLQGPGLGAGGCGVAQRRQHLGLRLRLQQPLALRLLDQALTGEFGHLLIQRLRAGRGGCGGAEQQGQQQRHYFFGPARSDRHEY